MPIRFLDLPHARLRIREDGRGGAPVVLAADPPNALEHYDELVAALARRRRVVVFEPPGFGLSRPRGKFGFRISDSARAVEEMLEALGGGPFALAFSCIAGYAAAAVAARRPDLVSHVALVQTPSLEEGRAWARRVDFKGLLSAPVVGPAVMALAPRKVARAWYAAALPRGRDAAPFVAPAMRAFDAGARFPLASFLRPFLRDPEPALAPIKQPALVVWGGADRTHRRTRKEETLALAPHARVVTFEDAGHFPELEEPERFAAELDRLTA